MENKILHIPKSYFDEKLKELSNELSQVTKFIIKDKEIGKSDPIMKEIFVMNINKERLLKDILKEFDK